MSNPMISILTWKVKKYNLKTSTQYTSFRRSSPLDLLRLQSKNRYFL
jgi:hypothetical protein